MDKILIATDLHMTPHGDTIIGLDPEARLRQVLDAALADHGDARALVLMGDLAHHGDLAAYQRLHDVLSEVPLPVIPMLGNHDRRDAFLQVFKDAPQTASGHVQHILDLPQHRIITLDTLDGPPYPTGHHAGAMCNARMAWLHAALKGAGDKMPLVFAHHPPFQTGIVGMDNIRLFDDDALMPLLAQHMPAHLFCGHIHRTISGSSNGVPWTMFKSPCHQGVLDLSDPDSSLSVDEPPAFGLLLLHPDGVVAHSQDVFASRDVQRDPAST